MDNREGLISVIVPVYNVEEYLPKCIESIIKQSHLFLQIILVDDGSTDASGEICDFYAEKDDRIQVFHKKNGGVVSARKVGLLAAQGEYIGFVDGDDYIDSQFYEVLLRDMLKNDVDLVHTGFIWKGKKYNQFESKRYDASEGEMHYLIRGLFDKGASVRITPSIWSKLYKKEFILKCHAKIPNELSYGEDLICICICLMEAKSIYLHDTTLYHYINREESLTDLGFSALTVKMAQLYHWAQVVFQDYKRYEKMLLFFNSYMAEQIFRRALDSVRDKGNISAFYLNNMEPFKGKKLVIYGAGKVGQSYYAQLSKYTSIEIVGWVDKNSKECQFDYAQVHSVEQLQYFQYDIILIAIKNEDIVKKIVLDLVKEWDVSKEKIWWQNPMSIYEEMGEQMRS